MRYLNKFISCKRLKQKRKNPPNDEVSAKRAWRRFNKKETRKACHKLQQGLCAYTELSLNSEILGNHLEHIAPRSRFPERTFMPDNLVLSVLDDAYSGTLVEEERFAGHYKKSQYADDWFISPYQQNCEDYFLYCADTGKVFSSQQLDVIEQAKAERTIAALNLNCDYLVEQRKKQLAVLEQQINALLSQKPVTETETETETEKNYSNLEALQQLKGETLTAIDKQLPEFYTAKKQLLERYIKPLT